MKKFFYFLALLCVIASAAVPALAAPGVTYLPLVVKGKESVQNGSFENGGSGWSWYPGDWIRTAVYSRTGSYSAALGDGSHNRVAYIQQAITVPSNKTTLVYYLRMISNDICGGGTFNFDYMTVTINDYLFDYQDVCGNHDTGNWERYQINLSAYAGQSVWLKVEFHSDSTLSSWLYADDFSFSSN